MYLEWVFVSCIPGSNTIQFQGREIIIVSDSKKGLQYFFSHSIPRIIIYCFVIVRGLSKSLKYSSVTLGSSLNELQSHSKGFHPPPRFSNTLVCHSSLLRVIPLQKFSLSFKFTEYLMANLQCSHCDSPTKFSNPFIKLFSNAL